MKNNNNKQQTTVYKTQRRKLNTKQHKQHTQPTDISI